MTKYSFEIPPPPKVEDLQKIDQPSLVVLLDSFRTWPLKLTACPNKVWSERGKYRTPFHPPIIINLTTCFLNVMFYTLGCLRGIFSFYYCSHCGMRDNGSMFLCAVFKNLIFLCSFSCWIEWHHQNFKFPSRHYWPTVALCREPLIIAETREPQHSAVPQA